MNSMKTWNGLLLCHNIGATPSHTPSWAVRRIYCLVILYYERNGIWMFYLFIYGIFYKRNKKKISMFSLSYKNTCGSWYRNSWVIWRTRNSYSSYIETLALRIRVPSSHNNFSFPQSSTRVSITRLLKQGKCFLFLHESVVQNLTVR